jgi:hypothetical protein
LAEALTGLAKEVKKELDNINSKLTSIKNNTQFIMIGEAIIFFKLLMDGWEASKDEKMKEQQMASFKKVVFSRMSPEDKAVFEAASNGFGFGL